MDTITAEQIGRKIIRLLDSIVNFAVLAVLLLLIAFAGYAIWDSGQVYQAADAAQYAVYKPTEEDSISFGELRTLNPEVFAWLTVYGTHIDYPVTQGRDNAKYVNTDVSGNYSLSGTIFLDYRNGGRFQDFNSILYGHHMEKNAMFGELASFAEKAFFDEHPYGNLFYDGENHGLMFFAFFKTDAYDAATFTPHVEGEEAQREYLQSLLDKAIHTRDAGVTEDSRILLLTTCATDATNGRDILVAKITDERYSDTFSLNDTNDTGIQVSADRQEGIWQIIPLWAKITVPALVLFLLLVMVLYHIRRKEE
ncbi:SrtB family sortase [Lacrimispora amygdalina]|uniref:SrtB family sortase n=1 Tax=Lacrimispora amygdalina TaxID=253257 RepID=A0A3E2NFF2_9FIRM|nr:class B sortase [Clostridium indicum]RFZ79610.1 SrtB family sortase [Clostridium indicum]